MHSIFNIEMNSQQIKDDLSKLYAKENRRNERRRRRLEHTPIRWTWYAIGFIAAAISMLIVVLLAVT